MSELPVIVVTTAYGGGWVAVCSCQWRLWHAMRPPVDREAELHRAACASKRRTG